MNVSRIISIAVIVLVILWWVKYGKSQGATRTFDERQKLMQGKAYKFGFLTTILMGFGFYLLSAFSEGVEDYLVTLLLLALHIGLMVFLNYCIWTDAYLGITEKRLPAAGFLALLEISQLNNLVTNMRGVSLLSLLKAEDTCMTFVFCITLPIAILLLVIKELQERKEQKA